MHGCAREGRQAPSTITEPKLQKGYGPEGPQPFFVAGLASLQGEMCVSPTTGADQRNIGTPF